MSFQNIFILGASGSVGTELINQVRNYDGVNHGHRNPTLIIGIANSTNYILSHSGVVIPEGIADKREMKSYINGSKESERYTSHEQILEAVRKSGMEGEVIFVDVSADGEKMVDLHKEIIGNSPNRMVTANKKPAAAGMQTFELITGNPHRYRYNTTVMAGAGAVPYFQEAHGLSEQIESVEGTFSGTLAYVCSELEKGEKPFSQIVREAHEKGYTEPHPMDDLNGEDVKRKLLILLRSSGIRIEEAEIELHGLVDPEEYKTSEGELMSVDDFLQEIQKEDAKIRDIVERARKDGFVPRYIASYSDNNGNIQARVGLEFVPSDSEIGLLKGTANKILVHTSQRTPKNNPAHIIQSPGAGVPKTAASVRADLLYLLNGTNLWQHN